MGIPVLVSYVSAKEGNSNCSCRLPSLACAGQLYRAIVNEHSSQLTQLRHEHRLLARVEVDALAFGRQELGSHLSGDHDLHGELKPKSRDNRILGGVRDKMD